MLNHWIDRFPPPPSGNQRIGGAVLERHGSSAASGSAGSSPNLVAVDFYERTGVLALAKRLNARPR